MLNVQSIDLFYGAAQALRKVSLTAELGRVTCVLGRNGVGKSSLLRAIVGQQPIRGGSISLAGQDVSRLPTHQRARRGIAYVPQGREIFPLLTVREPSIIKDIGRAIEYLRGRGDMAIVLVEQYFEFARDLADSFAVMDRGSVVMAGAKADLVEHEVRAHLSV